MQKATLFTKSNRPSPGDLSEADRRFLAEGDSWYTIGTLNLGQATNVLQELTFKNRNVVMSFAYPGHTLQDMVDCTDDPDFDRALWNREGKNFASFWEGILISAGGNDLIAAAQVPPLRNGEPVPREQRLFLTAAEADRSAPFGPLGHISEAGWTALGNRLFANFQELLRRKNEGESMRSPLFLHTYAIPAARPSGTVGAMRGWMFPAMEKYQIDENDRQAVCVELFRRLREFLLSLDCNSGHPRSLPKVHVFDSAGLTDILPASAGAPGSSGDWVNEIHLSASGYQKMGPEFGSFIDRVVDEAYGPIPRPN